MDGDDFDYESVLRREFAGADGSFLVQLQSEARWDRDAFARLVAAMEVCARAYVDRPKIERWVARGFWYLREVVPEWSSHPGRLRPEDSQYYQDASTRLYELAYWLFFGESPIEGRGPLKVF